MKLFSNIVSILFHPLLMVTYGIVLALTCTFLSVYPLPMKLWIIGGTFVSTALMPGAFIYMLITYLLATAYIYITELLLYLQPPF